MASSTHVIALTPGEYTNVSNGNLNCAIFMYDGQQARAVVGPGDVAPDAATEVYVLVTGPAVFQVENLAAEDELWLMLDDDQDAYPDIRVVRGGIRITMGA